MSLESRLNMTLARLRVIEEALHGEHLWGLRFGGLSNGLVIPAKLVFTDAGVQFVVRVPADVPHEVVELVMDGETVLVTPDAYCRSYPFLYVWTLEMGLPLAVG